jgi:hypothetical protein
MLDRRCFLTSQSKRFRVTACSFSTAYGRLTWRVESNWWGGVEGLELKPTWVIAGSEVMALVSRENATEPDCDTEQSTWDVKVLRASIFGAHHCECAYGLGDRA